RRDARPAAGCSQDVFVQEHVSTGNEIWAVTVFGEGRLTPRRGPSQRAVPYRPFAAWVTFRRSGEERMRLSQRMARLGTETAFEVLGRARALEARGKHVIHLEIGEPDFDTPAHITEAAVRALKGGATHYGPAAGIPELRAAVAEDTARRRGVRATPEMVVITPGAKPIMFFVILALVDEGDEVLYPNPGFPIYESMIRYI